MVQLDFQDRLKIMYLFEWAVHPMSLLLFGLPLGLTLWWLSSRRNDAKNRINDEKVFAWFNQRYVVTTDRLDD